MLMKKTTSKEYNNGPIYDIILHIHSPCLTVDG